MTVKFCTSAAAGCVFICKFPGLDGWKVADSGVESNQPLFIRLLFPWSIA